jgi:hypothetical protein
MELLALGAQPPPTAAQHNGVPAYILLGRPWPQRRPITYTTVVFIDNLSRQLVRIDNVNITLRPGFDAHRLSPGEFDLGHFMFGSMLDLTTSPSTRYDITIWRRVPAYLVPDADNRIHDLVAPPWDMHHFTLGAAVPRPLLVAARQEIRATTDTRAHYYSFYGYIGNLSYCFKFDIHRTINNVILADPVQGSLHIKVAGIL